MMQTLISQSFVPHREEKNKSKKGSFARSAIGYNEKHVFEEITE